tara:strand:- start:810 stop:1271 length:462 start_codon:yes stop_codon:yes gene_type:complete
MRERNPENVHLLLMEIQDLLPIELADSHVSKEEEVWNIMDDLSEGLLNSDNTSVVLNRNKITHVLLNKEGNPDFEVGSIVVPLQARELVIERFREFTLWYDNDVRFAAAYRVIDFRDGSSTFLVENLSSGKRDELPTRWFEIAEVFGRQGGES